ncbi:MAG TPA: NAD(P)H-dependent oxidoreductase [Candidatus Saccharimonadales bacterium]|nr:NAD(P)H-dependent oxidoreductase [Candidatus Saccharimonadales bacterium]
MTNIMVIAGSVRPGRFNIQPATWITDIAKKHAGIDVTLVDLQELGLPFYDEPKPAMFGNYVHPHTKKWAEMVGKADGFIFVTPEYNHSYSPVLANALNFLNAEWNYKPVSFVSYGSAAGGARAVEHLRGIAGELRMFDLRDQLLLPNYWSSLDDKGNYKFTEQEAEQAGVVLTELSTWAKKMKVARES